MKIILASASPRRKRLLKRVVRNFRVVPAHISERLLPKEGFCNAAKRLAEKKAKKIAKKEGGAIVIGADTIAYRGKGIYRKTGDKKIARKILWELQGKTHFVVTGVALLYPDGKCLKYCVRAAVKMKKFSKKELASYLQGEEWKGRAGCYDYSGKGKRLILKVKGEKETVVGLPIKRLRKILRG